MRAPQSTRWYYKAPIGERFGRWTVIDVAETRNNLRRVLCRCECGTQRIVVVTYLRIGKSKSCGCYSRDVARSQRTHGHSVDGCMSPTYRTWSGMLTRCENANDRGFVNYGGRGIEVCERWHIFANFLADMGVKPVGFTIERLDNNRGYEPGNCAWKTVVEQNRNRRGIKLNVESVAAIRAAKASGEQQRRIAKRYAVCEATVSMIVSGKLWRPA